MARAEVEGKAAADVGASERILGSKRLNDGVLDHVQRQLPDQPFPICPECGSEKVVRAGFRYRADKTAVQRWLCKNCGTRLSERSPCPLEDSNLPSGPLKTNSDWSLNTPSSVPSKRQVCVALARGAKNLDSTAEIKTVAGEEGNLVDFAWRLKKRGLQDSTIALRTYLLNQLVNKGANLHDTDSVETVLATENFTVSKKAQLVAAYRSFTKVFKIPWEPIKTHYQAKQPHVPLESELDQLIAASGKRTATFLQCLKDTGARAGEVSKLTWADIDEAKRIVRINCPEKGSNSRTIKVHEKTIAMLKAVSRKYDPYIFNPNPRVYKDAIRTVRRKVAQIMQDPRFKLIHLHSFRHWKATTEYAKTLNLPHVMDLLGHKSIKNTQIYMHLANFESNEFHSAVAKSVEEARPLIEAGFSFVCDMDGTKLFSKRK